jgi:hypothetical protein
VDGIGILIAKLLNYLLDPVEFFSSSKISYHTLKTATTVSFTQRSWTGAYSKAPTFRLSYNLSFKARWIL